VVLIQILDLHTHELLQSFSIDQVVDGVECQSPLKGAEQEKRISVVGRVNGTSKVNISVELLQILRGECSMMKYTRIIPISRQLSSQVTCSQSALCTARSIRIHDCRVFAPQISGRWD